MTRSRVSSWAVPAAERVFVLACGPWTPGVLGGVLPGNATAVAHRPGFTRHRTRLGLPRVRVGIRGWRGVAA